MTDLTLSTRESIRRYYDQNTKLFIRFGRENETYSIHRALWFQGIADSPHALNASNELLRVELQTRRAAYSNQPMRVLDLGCGVGGTLFYLLEHDSAIRGVGITLSAVQAEMARARARSIDLPQRAFFVQGDFQTIPAAQEFDAAYSIEAFAHATKPEAYIAEVARVLHSGGRLILCDDFRAARKTWTDNERAWLDAYQIGWHVPQLQTVTQVQKIAERAGLRLIMNRELTPFLKLRALPDCIARAVRLVGTRLPVQHPIVPSMLGSMALQQCLKTRLIEYRWLVFEKST